MFFIIFPSHQEAFQSSSSGSGCADGGISQD
jgi:hypothetical protein